MKIFVYILIISFFLVSSAQATTNSAEVFYAKAYSQIYKNNPKEAIKIFQKAIEYYPDCAFLYAGMGDAYLKENNLDKALNYYIKAQKAKYSIDTYKVDFYNAKLLKSLNKINLVKKNLFHLTKSFDSPVLYKNINFLMNEKYSQTIFLTELYLNTNDKKLDGINYIKNKGELEKAITEYLKLYNENPTNYKIPNNLAVTLYELKDYNLAEKYLKIALEKYPKSPLILNNLAVVNFYQNKFSESEIYFKKATELNANYLPALNNTQIFQVKNELNFYKSENINTLIDIIKKDNENYYAIKTLAKIYLLKNDFENAYNIIKNTNSEYNFKFYLEKAKLAYKNQKHEKALEYINTAISLYSDNPEMYIIKGKIYTELEEFKSANENFELAYQKDKNIQNLEYFKAQNEYKNGSKKLADSLIKEFLKKNKGNENTNYLNLLFSK